MSFPYLMVDHHLVVAKVWVVYLYPSPIIGEQKVEVEPCDNATAETVRDMAGVPLVQLNDCCSILVDEA